MLQIPAVQAPQNAGSLASAIPNGFAGSGISMKPQVRKQIDGLVQSSFRSESRSEVTHSCCHFTIFTPVSLEHSLP